MAQQAGAPAISAARGVPNKKVHAGHFAIRLERACVVSMLLSMMSQVNGYIAMPSYNTLLAGWGLFTAYSRSGRAVFGLLGFLSVSLLLDIVFLSIWSSGDADILSRDDNSAATSTTAFSVVMMCMNLVTKVAILYYAAHLFAVLSPSSSLSKPGNQPNDVYKPASSKKKPQERDAAEASDETIPPSPLHNTPMAESGSGDGGISRTSPSSSRGVNDEFKSDTDGSLSTPPRRESHLGRSPMPQVPHLKF